MQIRAPLPQLLTPMLNRTVILRPLLRRHMIHHTQPPHDPEDELVREKLQRLVIPVQLLFPVLAEVVDEQHKDDAVGKDVGECVLDDGNNGLGGLDGDGIVVCDGVVHGQAEGRRDDAVAEDVGFEEGENVLATGLVLWVLEDRVPVSLVLDRWNALGI